MSIFDDFDLDDFDAIGDRYIEEIDDDFDDYDLDDGYVDVNGLAFRYVEDDE